MQKSRRPRSPPRSGNRGHTAGPMARSVHLPLPCRRTMRAAIRAHAFGFIPQRRTVNGDRKKLHRMMKQAVQGDLTLAPPYTPSRFPPNPALLALQDQFEDHMLRLPVHERAEGSDLFYFALRRAMAEVLDDIEDEVEYARRFGIGGVPYIPFRSVGPDGLPNKLWSELNPADWQPPWAEESKAKEEPIKEEPSPQIEKP